MTSSVRWRRLDLPGNDEARLVPVADGYTLFGHARFQNTQGPVDLEYLVGIDAAWVTRRASVRGTTPAGRLDIEATAHPDRTWTFNGRRAPQVAGCVDFDLGFTPATNILSIRRLVLPIGERAEVTVASLPSIDATALEPLRQVYHRVAEDRFAYSCPDIPFDSTLRVDTAGFVRDYPPLWYDAT